MNNKYCADELKLVAKKNTLPPVRRVVRPTGVGFRGKFPSTKTERPVSFESLLERDALLLFEFSRGILAYREQPLSTFYPHNGRMRKYTPDFEVTLVSGGTRLIEVKPTYKLRDTTEADRLVCQVWVGCPLRVHRRCDDPMFTISNQIAYDGLMVYGKEETSTPLPKSCWIDVVGKTSEGNWIPEEGEVVQALLMELRERHRIQPADIFMISPFRDCANRLERLARQLGFDTQKTGTVHTTQGKEAEVVVLVLGGNPQKPGAKGWAASRPNLLNVAVSRAKKKLYVVGNRTAWQKLRYFSTLSQRLPDSGAAWPDRGTVRTWETRGRVLESQ